MDRNQLDFWWLTPEEIVKYKYVCVCHQEPYSDEPNSNREPTSVPRYFSLDTSGNLSKVIKRYPLDFIRQWSEKCTNTNIFRSFNLFTAEQDGEEVLGPFLIDIDREEDESGKGYVQNLNEALKDTRQLVEEYLCKFKEGDYRILFTGHKGFNIEVRPRALGITCTGNRQREFERRLRYINKVFGGSSNKKFVDKIHDEIRLHNSINRWIANDGNTVNRMKFELGIQELSSLSADEICQRSENLALNYLSKKHAV